MVWTRCPIFIKSVTNMEVPCSKARGRPRKTWSDCVKADMNACSIGGIDPQNRTALRSGIRSISHLLPTQATGTNCSSWKIKSGSSQDKSSQVSFKKVIFDKFWVNGFYWKTVFNIFLFYLCIWKNRLYCMFWLLLKYIHRLVCCLYSIYLSR